MTAVMSGWVQAAHGDVWQALAVAGAAELPGVRVAATGLAHPQWNSGDVDDCAVADVEQVRRWYAERGVPWGLRVPAGGAWPHGRRLLTLQLMGMTPERFAPEAVPAQVVVRHATGADTRAVAGVDSAAFGGDGRLERQWLGLLLAHPAVTVGLAEVDGEPVATGYLVRSDGRAGPAAYVGGVGVLPRCRRRGIGAALSSWLIGRGFAGGARLAHLFPATDAAASIYARLGFTEVDGLDVYVDH